jgi:phosphotransferase system  glucose/maltose/N-acetylglucosamine-specific IIC component
MAQKGNQSVILIPSALQLVGIIGGVWGILVVLSATLAYLPEHLEFSLFTTYLSDIGATPGWPQILFNAGTLIAAPIRYLVLVLLALRLGQLGAGRAFLVAVLIIGLISGTGSVVMTAVPFSVSLAVHKSGIPLYFLGVVVLQMLIGIREWSLPDVPRVLPGLCFLMVVVYFIFAILVILHEQEAVSRNTPVIWEWLAFLSSMVWVFAQSILLGKRSADR